MLEHTPFSDFMTPMDPVSPDVTNHVIDLLSMFHDKYETEIDRGLDYLKRSQKPDGAWYGRWGVNNIYGTGLVLVSLNAAGEDMKQKYVQNAVKWLKAHQNPDGGWVESCRSYDDPSCCGRGESTASQTALALLGFIAAGEAPDPNVQRGIAYLVHNQQSNGAWLEEAFIGTRFPRAFYCDTSFLKYTFL